MNLTSLRGASAARPVVDGQQWECAILNSDSAARRELRPRVVMVYGHLTVGGIETLIVRLARTLVLHDVEVCICYMPGGGLDSHIDSRVHLIEYQDTGHLSSAIRSLTKILGPSEETLILSFDPISAARGLALEAALARQTRVLHLSGVFHPHAYFMKGERRDRKGLNHLVARAVGMEQLFFMNSECRSSHADRWKRNLSRCPILPLPIETADACWAPSTRLCLHVVSVGRLVPFKSYNVGAAAIVKEGLRRGIAIKWDIYGDGPDEAAITKAIQESGVTALVRLKGTLGYQQFASCVSQYDLFVGMGTAALEAAMVGVPTICATVDEPGHCYGYLDALPFGNVGERLSEPPTVDIGVLLEAFSAMDAAEKVRTGLQCRSVALQYSTSRFLEDLRSAAQVAAGSPRPSIAIKKCIAAIYRYVTESRMANLARAVRRGFMRQPGQPAGGN